MKIALIHSGKTADRNDLGFFPYVQNKRKANTEKLKQKLHEGQHQGKRPMHFLSGNSILDEQKISRHFKPNFPQKKKE